MSLRSCTAPEITPDFEREEREGLPEEELRTIHDEIYGTNRRAGYVETEEMRNNAPMLLKEALDVIPEIEKRDYLEAMERNPELVERESNAVAFMRSDRYNAWACARRIINYWKERRRLFGPKAFEPMTVEGAMSEDVEALRKGIAEILPNDEHGRPVFFLDRTRITTKERKPMLRVIFYMLHVSSERDSAQTEGTILLFNLKGFNPLVHFDRMVTKTVFKLLYECMPTRMLSLHGCVGQSLPSLDIVFPMVKQIGGKRFRLRYHVHSGTDEEILAKLGPFGLVKENIVNVLGGSLASDYQSWLDERTRLENSTNRR